MTIGRAAAICFFGAIALFATAARAVGPEAPAEESAERARIVILCAEGDPFGMRLAAELKELGFDPIFIAPESETASRASLEASARQAGAIAAIRAVPSGRGVEVWIADRVTGKTLLREMEDSSADPDSALVLRTVELLRASLLEISLPDAPAGEVPKSAEIARKLDIPPPGALDSRPPPPAEPPPPPISVRFAIAPGLLVSPGGFGPIPTVGLGIEWRWSENIGIAGLGTIPLASASVERPEGTSNLAVWMAGASVRFFLAEPESSWSPSIDVGALALSLASDGRAAEGYIARSSHAWTGAPFLRVGLAHPLAQPLRMRLRADLLVGAVTQGVSVRVADREAATWGQPMMLISFGVDCGWF